MFDRYGRPIGIGDYVLMTSSFTGNDRKMSVGRVVDITGDSLLVQRSKKEGKEKLGHFLNSQSSYKIEVNNVELLEKFVLNDGGFGAGQATPYIIDILGRKLNLGDLVLYMQGYDFTINKLRYGILIDNKHILEYPNLIRKVGLVYKIEKPAKEEVKIYKSLSNSYNIMLKKKAEAAPFAKGKNNINNLQTGDIFRKGNIVYMYIGKYFYENIKDDVSVRGKLNKGFNTSGMDVDLYFYFNLVKARSVSLYEDLMLGKFDRIEEKVEKTQSRYSMTYFAISQTKNSLGKFVGQVNYKEKQQYLCFYKDLVCHRFTKV